MKNIHHREILTLIEDNSGKATQHTFLDSYLGNDHPRYPISAPVLRRIAKDWMKAHKDLTAEKFSTLLSSLIEARSSTEKCMAGILLDCSTKDQRKFDPSLFDKWLDHLIGWAEVDSVCTGAYTKSEIPLNIKQWKPLLNKFSKSKNIQKRRASVVLLCSPLSQERYDILAEIALTNVGRLKSEKEILITRAISWILRSMIRYHRDLVSAYIKENAESLPKIAVRETLVKLKTGKKTGGRRSKVNSPRSTVHGPQ
jgi:3-methyladenine DNA glycosylase AlkD